MGYNQLSYLLGFLPLVFLLFSICPKRSRRYVLAGASWLYFFLCSRYLMVYLLGTTVWAYLMGIWIGAGMVRTGKFSTAVMMHMAVNLVSVFLTYRA